MAYDPANGQQQSFRDERIYVIQIQIQSGISFQNPNPKTDRFKIQILFKSGIYRYVVSLHQVWGLFTITGRINSRLSLAGRKNN